MNTRAKDLLYLVILATWALSFHSATVAQVTKGNAKRETTTYAVTGADPKAFADASGMLAVPKHKLLDDAAADKIVAALEGAIKKGDTWSPAMWSQLVGLRSARVSALRMRSLQDTASRVAVAETPLPADKSAVVRRAFEQGNRQYEAGNFEQAVESYRSALAEYPAYWDAWNNMALAEMHSNNDLLALFLLSALTKNNPKYSGASINLSVCLERLGQSTAAYKLATEMACGSAPIPMAQYNVAWFEHSRGKYDAADLYLDRALASLRGYAVAKWLRTINMLEQGREVTEGDLKALLPVDQVQGIPKAEISSVIVGKADAYSGSRVVATLGKGTRLAVVARTGEWSGFYWPVDGTKHLLWVRNRSIGGSEIKPFLGTWSGTWGSAGQNGLFVSVRVDGLVVKDNNGRPAVTLPGATISEERIENGKLLYKRIADATGWEFTDTLIPASNGLKLEVFRVRDSRQFTGTLKQN